MIAVSMVAPGSRTCRPVEDHQAVQRRPGGHGEARASLGPRDDRAATPAHEAVVEGHRVHRHPARRVGGGRRRSQRSRQHLVVGQPDGANVRGDRRSRRAREVRVPAEAGRHRGVALVGEGQGHREARGREGEALGGAVGPRPGGGGVAILETRLGRPHRDRAPGRLPAVAVNGVALRRPVQRQRDGAAAKREAALADAIGIGHEREGRGPVGKGVAQRLRWRRAQPLPRRAVALEPVAGDRAPDRRRDREARAARPQGDQLHRRYLVA